VPFVIEPMTQDDVSEVSQVERRCFNNPWPTSAYRRELRDPEHNYYIVARWRDPRASQSAPNDRPRGGFARLPFLRRTEQAAKGPIFGFAGMWLMLDEAHITTIGVAPEQRGKALGEMLFVNLMDEALRRRARWMTLEVRVSNESALGLYAKYGFTQQGLRKRYYSDNGEDAYIMWSPPLNEPPMPQRLQELRATLSQKLARWHNSLDDTGTVPGSGFRVPG
jgi:[ribosomal protein S18]-alanine N-acetyltransferase